jgi:transposase-like protein
VSDQQQNATRKPRRRLAPSEKYEIYVQVLTQQATQREAAQKWGVDRSTIISICRTAKQGALDALAAAVPGRPGASVEAAALAEAKAEIERLRATVTEQAVAMHLQAGKARWD